MCFRIHRGLLLHKLNRILRNSQSEKQPKFCRHSTVHLFLYKFPLHFYTLCSPCCHQKQYGNSTEKWTAEFLFFLLSVLSCLVFMLTQYIIIDDDLCIIYLQSPSGSFVLTEIIVYLYKVYIHIPVIVKGTFHQLKKTTKITYMLSCFTDQSFSFLIT